MPDYRAMIRDILDGHRLIGGELPYELAEKPTVLRDGCPPEEIAALEARLGLSLSPSYREFLAQVNGCDAFGVDYERLYRADQVDWFRARNQAWIDIWVNLDFPDLTEEEHRNPHRDQDGFRRAYLPHLIQIGEEDAGAVYLLNPLVLDAEGEWEVWHFHSDGASRSPSFATLVESIWVEIRRDAGTEPLPKSEDLLIAEALAVVRRRIVEDRLRPGDAIEEYVRSRCDDPIFIAWARKTHPAYALTQALRAEGLG